VLHNRQLFVKIFFFSWCWILGFRIAISFQCSGIFSSNRYISHTNDIPLRTSSNALFFYIHFTFSWFNWSQCCKHDKIYIKGRARVDLKNIDTRVSDLSCFLWISCTLHLQAITVMFSHLEFHPARCGTIDANDRTVTAVRTRSTFVVSPSHQ